MKTIQTSIIIPARNEQFLQKTITDLLSKAETEVEIIAVLDGYWPSPPLLPDDRLKIIHRGVSRGMRAAINSAVAIAKGKYILKIDAHCLVGQGYDRILAEDCEENWISVPRRKRLDAEKWCEQDVGKPDIDYMYLHGPDDPADWGGPGLNGKVWETKNRDPKLKEILIDDCVSSQGSMWFMHRDYFYELELMDEENYGTFWNENQETNLKCWLSGGRCIVNKKTFYCHLHKGKTYGRGYHLQQKQLDKGSKHTRKWLTNEAWAKQTLPFSWLIEKFPDMPSWDGDWKTRFNYKDK